MAEMPAESNASLPAAPEEADRPFRAGGNADVPDMLEQLRTLGELRDAGYVTDVEFEQIKRRILDGEQ